MAKHEYKGSIEEMQHADYIFIRAFKSWRLLFLNKGLSIII